MKTPHFVIVLLLILTSPLARADGAEQEHRTVAVAKLDYDWKTGKGGGLSGLTMRLDDKGITSDRLSKSGWINMDTWGEYKDDKGVENKVLLKNVCFWVNDGGKNWWDFTVEKALQDGKNNQPVTMATKVETLSKEENRPVVILGGKYKLVPRLNSLNDIIFVQER